MSTSSRRFPLAMLSISFALLSSCSSLDEPGGVSLEVPFSSQAPDDDWSEPWQNACEETSIVMIDNFFSDNAEIDREQAKLEILAVMERKNDLISVSKDESSYRIVELINASSLGWTAHVREDPTLEEMRGELIAGRPIIVPIWAPDLNNPHYVAGGPDYHVMVVVGYRDENQVFIVNDPGTAQGEGLEFSYDAIMGALVDFDDENNRVTDAKRVIFTKQGPFDFIKELIAKGRGQG